ncbi:MAG: flagellar hook-associated protein FlgL [Firmicutes bacterium]|nr:flagellar hook-associated protein FlgL [Bacillota bacterium]
MRVTNSMLLKNYTRNLHKNLNKMSKYQNQLSSGKEISKPSDDPFLVTRSMALHTEIDKNEQYKRNIEDSIGWIDTTDSAMQNVTDIIHRMKELTTYGANGSLSDTDRQALSEEVKQLTDQLGQIGSTNFDGRYIFGGQETTEAPFKVEGGVLKYKGDKGELEREFSPNVSMAVNLTGAEMMGLEGSVDTENGTDTSLGVTLKEIVDALDSNDTEKLSGELLGDIDNHLDNILRARAKVGAKSNRLKAANKKNEAETLNTIEFLSKTEDIDVAEKVMQYKNMENVYRSSLQTGAKILQPSLLDFLR